MFNRTVPILLYDRLHKCHFIFCLVDSENEAYMKLKDLSGWCSQKKLGPKSNISLFLFFLIEQFILVTDLIREDVLKHATKMEITSLVVVVRQNSN